ncbi:hypothetical protein [Geomonas sp.]|uniref:hypothetical protein n=1 Tax=Geomonas sp. TaxID=2651584 RepID=UPI002B4859D9|nr:hypothetical protein [Geomonas sp.]
MAKLPTWLMLVIGLMAVVVIGVLDYVTGDYSLLIFYAIPVAIEGWYVGRWGAILIGIASGLARLISDNISYSASTVRYWNSLQDMFFLLMVGMLVALIKKLMTEDQSPMDD